ncbi:MAG: hypothetical protein E3J37_01040 [Anaerolineales bacterium]|nr:MAG: hypothetical protein E3J37_01040 [Anaerolineales bacterium]
MTDNDSQIQDEQPDVESMASEAEPPVIEPVEAEIEAPEVESVVMEGEPVELLEEVEPAKPPSKFRRFLSRALRWVTGFVVVFAFGVAATWVVQVRPGSEQIGALRGELDSAQAQIDSLEGEVESLHPLEGENSSLRTELTKIKQRMDILSVLVDVTTAQLAMAQDDPIAAKAALAGTDDRLMAMDMELVNAETVEGFRTRLALVLEEVDDNAFAAQRDLQILASNLLSLERSLFGE